MWVCACMCTCFRNNTIKCECFPLIPSCITKHIHRILSWLRSVRKGTAISLCDGYHFHFDQPQQSPVTHNQPTNRYNSQIMRHCYRTALPSITHSPASPGKPWDLCGSLAWCLKLRLNPCLCQKLCLSPHPVTSQHVLVFHVSLCRHRRCFYCPY